LLVGNLPAAEKALDGLSELSLSDMLALVLLMREEQDRDTRERR